MKMTAGQKAALLAHAERAAARLSDQYGRARIGGPTYTAADLPHDGWSVRVTALLGDDIEGPAVDVYMDGTELSVPAAEARR